MDVERSDFMSKFSMNATDRRFVRLNIVNTDNWYSDSANQK